MKRIASALVLSALGLGVCLTAPQQVEARQPYLKSFIAKYGEVEAVKTKAEELKCGVCHGEGGKNKKVVSDYGKALAQALGEKNVKSTEKLEKAYGEIESKKDSGNDKTYGELLKAGELPKQAE